MEAPVCGLLSNVTSSILVLGNHLGPMYPFSATLKEAPTLEQKLICS
jgi:hypothetical protein